MFFRSRFFDDLEEDQKRIEGLGRSDTDRENKRTFDQL